MRQLISLFVLIFFLHNTYSTRRRIMALTKTILVGASAILLLVGAGCATDQAALQRRLEANYRLLRPAGAGPFPAVMLVPGASGFQPARIQALYGPTAERLRETGYVVAFVDYHAAYGLPKGPLAQTSKEDIARAILVSAAYLKSLPFVKSTQIGVLGWSRGGWGTLAALASISDRDPKPFQAAVLFYPGCQGLEPWRANVPILMLLGEEDNVTPPAFCVELTRRVANPSAVEVKTYRAARHGFDISDLPEVAPFPSGKAGEQRTIGYNRDAAVRAHDEVQQFFKRVFGTP